MKVYKDVGEAIWRILLFVSLLWVLSVFGLHFENLARSEFVF